jgi:hypothetical protein
MGSLMAVRLSALLASLYPSVIFLELISVRVTIKVGTENETTGGSRKNNV